MSAYDQKGRLKRRRSGDALARAEAQAIADEPAPAEDDVTEPIELTAQQALVGQNATLYIRPVEDGSVDWTLESPDEGHAARVQLAQALIDDSCDLADTVRRLTLAGYRTVLEGA